MTAARTRTPHSPPATSGGGPRPGLRERKKIRTRTAIRDATYRLIQEQGYDATTVEQIAEAAEVSPSTVFRYFPAKEDIVVSDAYDPPPAVGRHPRIEAGLRARPAEESLIESLRIVMREFWAEGLQESPEITRLRARLLLDVPAVRARMRETLSVTGRVLCRILAERTGRDAEELEVRVFAMGLMGALMEALLYWAESGHRDELPDLVDRTLATFQNGPGR